jgi:pimeloyl-ACP methyl ester carboxylesterase
MTIRGKVGITIMPQYHSTPNGRLAYHQTPGTGCGIVFLGGFRSDMEGSKAVYLEDWAKSQGRPFLRFDYTGHGQSDGAFTDGCIGTWADDARAILDGLTTGPQILIGSSMGGWISLLLARAQPARVAGLVTIAAAPDFTDAMWAEFGPEGQATIMAKGQIERPSDYGSPYIITRRLIEDGTKQRIFDRALDLPMPVRMLQGTRDEAVPTATALRLLDHAAGPDIRLTLVKDADHRFSTPACLAMISDAVLGLSA